jgi:hypothetical protein
MANVIRNGLYSISTELLDGVHGGATGISMLRNGKMLGGGSVLLLEAITVPTASGKVT